MARKKIALIGAGMIGGTLAHLAAKKEMGDIVLFDIAEGIPQGKALDLPQCRPGRRLRRQASRAPTTMPTSPAPTWCIVTAGVPRKPGMSRDDLLGINLKVMKAVGEGIKAALPRRLRHLHHQPARRDGLGAARILRPAAQQGGRHGRRAGFGAASAIFLAEEFQVSVEDVNAFVLGGHGDTMVPVTELLDRRRHPGPRPGQDGLVDAGADRRDRQAHPRRRRRDRRAAEDRLAPITPRRPPRSPWPRAYLEATRSASCPARVISTGQYGLDDLYVGVPTVIGAKGVERIVEIALDDEAKQNFQVSVDAVKELLVACKQNRREPR